MKFRSIVLLGLLASCRGTTQNNTQNTTTQTNVTQSPPDAGAAARSDVRVVEMRNADSPLVTFRVVIEAGSADDPAGKEGMGRVMARLMAEGGTRELTYEQFTRRLFPMAAQVSYEVERETTVFVGQVHRDHVAEFYPLFRDVVLHPRLEQADFDRVRTQSLSDLTDDLRGANDEALGKEVLQSLIHANHPYGHPPVGTETGLAALTLDAVRAQRDRVLCAQRVVVGLAGGYPADLLARVRSDFGELPARCEARSELPTVNRPEGMHVVIVDKPTAGATAISIGFPINLTRRDASHAAVQFVTNHLGLHRQSVGVLYQTIRESRGLNYGDYAYAEHFEQDPGSRFPRTNIGRRQQYASVWIRPVPAPKGHFALRAAMRAVDRVVQNGMAQPDIERVRTFLNGYVGLYAQTESLRLGYAIDDLLLGATGGTYPERMRAAWASLDADAVRTAARDNLTARDVWVAIVAPNANALAQAIRANAPSPITYDSPKGPAVLAEDREIAAFRLPVRAEDVRVVPAAEVFH